MPGPLLQRAESAVLSRSATGTARSLPDSARQSSRTERGRVAVAKAKNRKGHYRAGHYVKPSSASSRWKTPSTGLVLAVAVLAIAGWNTLFGSESDDSNTTPHPQPSSSSAPAVSGQ